MITLIQKPDFAEISATSSANLRNQHVLSLVEKGWAGARQLSIPLSQRGFRVQHLVKGTISREVLEALTPYPGLSVRGIPRRLYRLAAWYALLRGDIAVVLVDNERSFRWVSRMAPWLKARLVEVHEADDGTPRIGRAGFGVDQALIAADWNADVR